jgi:hypothetical protein
MSPFVFCGVPLFSSEIFLMSPFAFCGGASFFVRGLFNEPMNEGSNSMPLLMASISCVKRLSNFQLTSLAVSTLV